MDKYEIGIRLRGYAKDYIKGLTCILSEKFKTKKLEKRVVPHLTLLRPFNTNEEQKTIQTFGEILQNYSNPLNYIIQKFGFFKNENPVLYAKVNENSEIKKMTSDLESSLSKIIKFENPKINLPHEKNILNLHSAILSGIDSKYFKEIKKFIETQEFQPITQPLFRMYLLKNNLILREYDFILNQNLNRNEATNPFLFNKTKNEFETQTGLTLSHDLTIRNNLKI